MKEHGQKINERIVEFLKQNTNLTIATCLNDVPACANCFYAYDEERNLLVFKSKPETNHIQQALKNTKVAGSIMPDKPDFRKIQGIQLQGNFLNPNEELSSTLRKLYYKKYPFAVAFSGTVWVVELTFIKMTDNTLGFGKKMVWEKG